jgi:hypothetical protein
VNWVLDLDVGSFFDKVDHASCGTTSLVHGSAPISKWLVRSFLVRSAVNAS